MLRIALPALSLALLAGCAASPAEIASAEAAQSRTDARLAQRLAGRVAGEPRGCLPTINLQSQNYGDTIVYRQGAMLWVNRTSGGCFGLNRDDIIITRTTAPGPCRGDIIQTADRVSGFPSGSCAFGDFIPYRRAGSRG